MKYWQEDLLGATEGAQREHVVFKKIEAAAQALGFEPCAFGLRVAQPFSSPKTIVLAHYAAPWWVRYIGEGSLHADLTFLHRHRAGTSLKWSGKVSRLAHQLRSEARNHGLHFGILATPRGARIENRISHGRLSKSWQTRLRQ